MVAAPGAELSHLAAVFKSFLLAGFEGSTGYNLRHQWIDQIIAAQHDRFVDQDYRRLREVGILAAREAVRWPVVDRRRQYEFSSVRPFLEAGQKHGVAILYALFHVGYPPDVNLFGNEFPRRFADYCHAAARYITQHSAGPYYFTPVNEPSFFAWAGGEAGLFAP